MKAISGGLFVLVALVTACGPPLVGVDPALSVAERDDLQRAMPRPLVENAAVYETVAADTEVPIPFTVFAAWFEEDGKRSLASFSVATERVSPIARTEDLVGSWMRPGDRRRIVYADGTAAVREILDIHPQVLEYVDWNLTNRAGRYLRYVVEQIAFWQSGTGTRLRWSSSFRPRPFPDDKLIESYVREDYALYLRGAVAAMKTRAVDQTSRRE